MLDGLHPSREQLARFAENRSDGHEGRSLLAHVAECLSCQAVADEVWWGQSAPPNDEFFSRLLERLGSKARAIEYERETAAKILPHLLDQPPLRRLTLVRNSANYRSAELCQSLLDTVRPVVFDDPGEAVDRARLALEMAHGLEPDATCSPLSLCDLRARAHSELANALRAANDLAAAEAEFRSAFEALAAGSGDPQLAAETNFLYAMLCGARRQTERGQRYLDLASRWFRRSGDSHRLGQTLLGRAWLLWIAGQPGEAVDAAERGHAMLEPGREPHLEFAALLARVRYLADSDRVEFAAEQLRRIVPSLQRVGVSLRRRAVWIAADIARKLGQTAQAEAALRRVVQEFVAAKLPYSAAVAAVELATVYFEQGRLREVRDLAASVYPVFAALGIDREALASLLLIQGAAEAETLTLELLQRLSQRADEAERHPLAPARAHYERSAVRIFRT